MKVQARVVAVLEPSEFFVWCQRVVTRIDYMPLTGQWMAFDASSSLIRLGMLDVPPTLRGQIRDAIRPPLKPRIVIGGHR